MTRPTLAALVIPLLIPLLASAQRGRPRAPQRDAPDGTIVRIEEAIVFFDVGDGAGKPLAEGQTIEVLRTINAKNPVTGAALVDYFPLGALTVLHVGHVLSSGRLAQAIAPLVHVGDVVRIPRSGATSEPRPSVPAREDEDPGADTPGVAPTPPPRAVAPPPARTPARGAPAAAPSPENEAAREVGRVFQSTLGRALDERIQILTGYIQSHPDSPFRDALRREVGSLRLIDETIQKAKERAAEAERSAKSLLEQTERSERIRRDSARTPVAAGTVPTRIYRGDPVEVAIYVANPQTVAAAFAYVRGPEELNYHRHLLTADGDGYFRGFLPPGEIAPPFVDVFAEAVDVDGRPAAALAASDRPQRIVVDEQPAGPESPGPNRSAIRGYFEFVDFNRFRGNDYYFLTEADFMYRIGTWFYAVRTGFGVMSGRGGRVVDLDAVNGPLSGGSPVGFNYGYVDTEFRFHRLFAMSGRLLIGHTMNGSGFGGELRMRIGNEMGTNLVLGGSIASDIGALGLLQLEWDVIHGWPMSASVVVTNQPIQTDLGVRLVYQIGYRVKPWIQPTFRIGYDVRNIEHGGLSLGVGLVMSW